MIKVTRALSLSDDVAAILSKCKHPIIIENNFTSQMARLIRMETGIDIKDKILKYDGEPYPAGDPSAYKEVEKDSLKQGTRLRREPSCTSRRYGLITELYKETQPCLTLRYLNRK